MAMIAPILGALGSVFSALMAPSPPMPSPPPPPPVAPPQPIIPQAPPPPPPPAPAPPAPVPAVPAEANAGVLAPQGALDTAAAQNRAVVRANVATTQSLLSTDPAVMNQTQQTKSLLGS